MSLETRSYFLKQEYSSSDTDELINNLAQFIHEYPKGEFEIFKIEPTNNLWIDEDEDGDQEDQSPTIESSRIISSAKAKAIKLKEEQEKAEKEKKRKEQEQQNDWIKKQELQKLQELKAKYEST